MSMCDKDPLQQQQQNRSPLRWAPPEPGREMAAEAACVPDRGRALQTPDGDAEEPSRRRGEHAASCSKDAPLEETPVGAGHTRGDGGGDDSDDDNGGGSFMHPRGVQPLGEAWGAHGGLARAVARRRASLGPYLALLDDGLIVGGLLSGRGLRAADLCSLAQVSRWGYALGTHEELWRELVLEDFGGDLVPSARGWKSTYVASARGRRDSDAGGVAAPGRALRVPGVYSDVLFQSHLCAVSYRTKSGGCDSAPWVEGSPFTLDCEDARLDSPGALSAVEFVDRYERRNRPVLLKGACAHWPALNRWTQEGLLRACAAAGEPKFRCGGFLFTLQGYLAYATALRDDQPLYLFDRDFFDKVPEMLQDFEVPRYFSEDLFSLLDRPRDGQPLGCRPEGAVGRRRSRPDYRWLIAGPSRSGSTFHVDPNGTSAWNAVVRGRKKWILLPPSCVPPGVHPSMDGADVCTSVSLIEWFMQFYAEARSQYPRQMREGICEAGDVLFVPTGWWHAALNLDDFTLAVTQNFVSRVNMRSVLAFIGNPEKVSGVDTEAEGITLRERFEAALREHCPDLLLDKPEGVGAQRARNAPGGPPAPAPFRFNFVPDG